MYLERINQPNDIKKIEENERESCIVQRRGLYVTKALSKGDIISRENIFPLRPLKENGIPPYEIASVIGKKVSRDLKQDSAILWEDLLND